MNKVLLRNFKFEIELHLVIQIPENTYRAVSGLILTSVLLRNIEFEIELYLVRQIPENTDRVVSRLILTKVLLRNFEFGIELYLVKQIPENMEGYTWIGTDLKLFIGVRHSLQGYGWSKCKKFH